MSAAFSQTTRALEADRGHVGRALAIGAVLVLGAWLGWAAWARMTVVELSASARLEVLGAVHPLAAQVGGRVVALHLPLGGAVRAGAVLVELDAERERRELVETERRLAALEPELGAVEAELAALAVVRSEGQRHLRAALRVAESRLSQDELRAVHADREAALQAALRDAHGASVVAATHAIEQAEAQRAEVTTRALESDAAARAGRVEDSLRGAELARLERERAELFGERAALQARAERLAFEVERRKLRAPIDGTVGRVSLLAVGAVVAEGDELALLVPDGELQVVAEFPAATALGRLASGQAASMRFDGFPFSQFGVLPVRVRTVGSEVREGRVRVELALGATEACRVPLRHGMSGVVAVDVERVSPATLGLRAAGVALGVSAR